MAIFKGFYSQLSECFQLQKVCLSNVAQHGFLIWAIFNDGVENIFQFQMKITSYIYIYIYIITFISECAKNEPMLEC